MVPDPDFYARLDERTTLILQELKEIRETMVTRVEFGPVRTIAYGLVSLVMISVVGALIAQVLTHGG